MKLNLIATMCLMWAIVMVSPLTTVSVFAQTKQTKDNKKKKKAGGDEVSSSKSATGSKGGDTDPNIKEGEAANNMEAPGTLPTAKGGKSKGAAYDCEVQLDNWSAWIVKIYINGAYRGYLSAGAESTLYYTPGQTTIYARADFTDGTYYYWGPKTYNCGANQYIYFKMNP